MHPMRLATLVTAIGVAACDPTARIRPGTIGGGGGGGGSGPHRLAFVVQPANAVVGEIITPAIQVAVRDTLGNTDPNFVGTVAIVVGSNPTGGFLEGTTTAALVSGVANFGNLSIDKAGNGYTFVASATGATQAASSGFAIVETIRGGSAPRR
jgi:hypothetical protein